MANIQTKICCFVCVYVCHLAAKCTAFWWGGLFLLSQIVFFLHQKCSCDFIQKELSNKMMHNLETLNNKSNLERHAGQCLALAVPSLLKCQQLFSPVKWWQQRHLWIKHETFDENMNHLKDSLMIFFQSVKRLKPWNFIIDL